MSAGSIFDADTKRGPDLKMVLIAVAAFIFLGAAGYTAYRLSAPPPPDLAGQHAAEIREMMIFMLAQRSFSGEEFGLQLLGRGRIEKYAWQKKEAYMTFPATDESEFQEFLKDHIIDVAKVTFATKVGDSIKLDDYELRPSENAARFFKTTSDNLKLNTTESLNFPFLTVNYTISPDELRNFANNSQLYGGKMVAKMPERRDEPQMVFANHGIMVAKPGEPSLKRLIDDLLKDVGDNREARIQRLVDFVSNEIEYSFTEAVASRERLKRASETLMTRSADCSNKTILLASMLEQINEEYILLYCPRHITVAIPQGNYTNENKLDFTWDSRPWLIAETTTPGFQIGKSLVLEPNRLTNVQYIQDPKNSNVIHDANSYQILDFF
jgi:hypothetical protein